MENNNGDVTIEDIESYIQYTKMLWDEIRDKFTGHVKIEETDAMKMLQSGIFDNINNNQVQTTVFNSLIEPFSLWMMHDCVFTGHKGMKVPGLKSLDSNTGSEIRGLR